MLRWVINVFWGPGRTEFMSPILESLKTLDSSLFAGDDMILLNRAISFGQDEKFMAAFTRLNPDRIEKAIAWRKHVLYWAARQVLDKPGDFVEAGCYKGFTARLLCDLTDFARQKRTYWLYDAFEQVDRNIRLEGHSPQLEAEVRARFADLPNVKIIAGRVPEAFQHGEPKKIALLHIDMNNAPAEAATLERLYDRVVPGGIIVFDDYGTVFYHEQRAAADRFAARHGKMVLELPTCQGMLIK